EARLDCHSQRHSRRLHGDSGHPDHQLLAEGYPGRIVDHHRGRLLDIHLLSGRGDHHHSAGGLAGHGAVTTAFCGQHLGALCHRLPALLHRLEPAEHDRVPATAGTGRGRPYPLRLLLVLTKLPLDIRPKGMALFVITATFAPAIGPTIGGWLTENFGWEWIFYINLVPGALM